MISLDSLLKPPSSILCYHSAKTQKFKNTLIQTKWTFWLCSQFQISSLHLITLYQVLKCAHFSQIDHPSLESFLDPFLHHLLSFSTFPRFSHHYGPSSHYSVSRLRQHPPPWYPCHLPLPLVVCWSQFVTVYESGLLSFQELCQLVFNKGLKININLHWNKLHLK